MPTPPDEQRDGLRIATVAGIPVFIGRSWVILAVVIVALVGPWAIGLPLLSGARPDLFRVVWTVLIAGFLWQGASAAIHAGTSLGVLARVDPRQVIRPAQPLSEGAPLADIDRLAAGSSDVAAGVVEAFESGLPEAGPRRW